MRAKLRPSRLVIILDDGIDFSWLPHEIQDVADMFKAGCSIEMLAALTKRDPDEVLMLLLHLRRAKKVRFEVSITREGEAH